MNNRLRDVWSDGRAGVNSWLAIPSTYTAEVFARQGFDSVTIDMQHGMADYATALSMLQAISTGNATPMVRVPWLEPGIIMRVLDAGALGVVCPMVNTRADAEAFVRYTHYAPQGERSFGPIRAQVAHGADYWRSANDQVITLAMVETRQALENLEAIVTTPGLTAVYIGPADLGLSLGHQPVLDQEEPAVLESIEHILARAKAAGIKAGIHCLAPAYAKRMIEKGFDLVTLGTDTRILGAAVAAALDELGS